MDVEIILLEDDPKLGKRGQVIKVSQGHASNFLIPNGRAGLATPALLKSFETEKARRLKSETQRKALAEALAAAIQGMTLTLEMPAGEGGKLYGAVTAQDILSGLASRGITLEKKDLHLTEPIHKLGTYEVPVKPHAEAGAVLKLSVVKKEK